MNDLAQRGALGLKPENKVGKKIRASAEGETCTLMLDGCDHDQTVIYAHLRYFGWAGIAEKPEEPLGVYACQKCHDILDGRKDGPCGFEEVLRALGQTIIRLKRKGLLVVK